jgi:hypothetical protein
MACIRFVVLVVVVALTSGQTPRDSGDSWTLIPGLGFMSRPGKLRCKLWLRLIHSLGKFSSRSLTSLADSSIGFTYSNELCTLWPALWAQYYIIISVECINAECNTSLSIHEMIF